MKKAVFMFLVTVILFTNIIVNASVGDVIGGVYHSDIVALINNYAIPSYAANGQTLIVVDDLKNFGFDVTWHDISRYIVISRNNNIYPSPMKVSKTGIAGSKFADLLETDIEVYAKGFELPVYAINGYIMIPLEELKVFGECNWVEEQRTIKLWIDGVHIRSTMQEVAAYVAPKTYVSQPVYSSSNKKSSSFVGSVNSYIYHYPYCTWAGKIKSYNRIWFTSAAHAASYGYRGCYVCVY